MKSKYLLSGIFPLIGIIVLISFSNSTFAQIGGLSGSKLGALCVDVVDHHKIEFEPAFYTSVSKQRWDNDDHLEDIYGSSDSVIHNTGMAFRFTYGLWDKMEIGASISTDLQLSSFGLRYIIFANEKNGLAAIAGANIPFGNKTIDNSIRLQENIASVGGGAVFSSQFTENLSLDLNAQYMFFLQNTYEQNKGSYFLNADLGYYIFDHQLQFITALAYQSTSFESFDSHVLTLNPGVTIETGKNYIIVLSAPFDITGKNSNKNAGFLMALTLTFD